MTFVSTSTSTSGGTSWRKPPPQFESAPRPASPSPPKTASRALTLTELVPKQHTRRHFGNGNATHAKNQSLMSIVADVTSPLPNGGEDKTRSLDIPRAPGSVLRETAEVGRRVSLTLGTGSRCGQDATEIGVTEWESSPVSESCSGPCSGGEEASDERRCRLARFGLDFVV